MHPYNGENPDVQYAYLTIAAFFDTYALADARRYTGRVMATAGAYHYWRGNPSNAVFFLEKLRGLVLAALTIHREEAQRPAALVEMDEGEVPSLTAYEQYCGWHHLRQPWYFFPRSLTAKEYANPYRVFTRLAAKGGKKKWKWRLEELQFYTLSNSCLNEAEDIDLNSLQFYRLLLKLVEAAHLVEVRAITEIGGEPRSKWKGNPETPPTTATTTTDETTAV